LHRDLAEAVSADGINLVFCCGPLMRNLWEALPPALKGGYADTSANLEDQVVGALRAGDAIMIKGSFGSRMKRIVDALARKFPERTPDEMSA
jgi:UDP-N-acetylmuramoyl-tripeptide--D-alanyl-D-alanine ligase